MSQDLRGRLARSGWEDRAEVIVIEPEFEIWVWTDSPVLERLLGWSGHRPGLRMWMSEHGFWPEDALKPPRPKESLEKVLRQVARRSTTAVFGDLAASMGLETCRDPSFLRCREILRRWFPGEREV